MTARRIALTMIAASHACLPLAHGEDASTLRPREAALVRDYAIQEVRFPGGDTGVTLAGELTHPHGEGVFPAVVLITGSGPQDRDEATGGHRPFLILSDYLVRQGFAVLRYDDRGVAASSGDFETAGVPDFAADAAAAMRWLQDQPSVDASRTGYVGHSEGGIAGPLAAQETPSAFLVLLAAPALHIRDILILREEMNATLDGTDPEATAAHVQRLRAMFQAIQSSTSPEQAFVEGKRRMLALGASEDAATGWTGAFTSGPLYWVAKYDPAPTLVSFSGPILALYGAEDRKIVPAQNAAVAERSAEHPASRVVIVPGMNHLFQPVATQERIEYEESDISFDDSALAVIGDWLEKTIGPHDQGQREAMDLKSRSADPH
ncbi:MAG: alpha/beta fold hydrolase [Pseudomonadota bacterium]